MKLTYYDIRGVFGILPTPATSDASEWSTKNSVNLPEVEKLVRLMVDAKVDLIATTGTFGECATLTREELVSLVECVVQTNSRSRPVFAGVTTLNTRDTIALARQLIEVGADGLFVGRPMWLAMDDDAIVRYYEDIARAMPGVPLVVYDNPVAFKGKISPAAYLRLAKIPEVVASKHTGGPQLLADLDAVGDRIRILPLATAWLDAAQAFPDRAIAAWSGSVACAPKFNMALAHAILMKDWTRAKALSDEANWAEAAMFANGDLAAFMDYSIQIGHLRFKSAGLIDPGPPRPPYLFLPDTYRDGAIECGRRWKELENRTAARAA
ncbi:dihydrodipicolinate synthase family protein [Tepidicella baoligensis]|uniref:dihydrodipicolinate synthase family protein n=1 Tax=Tepidicella baoligensis TaxID=2707016 RepID=UPI0015DAEA4A|nr:dihydrodipicolinate synthase family protein [Tepidicella baoligensis]